MTTQTPLERALEIQGRHRDPSDPDDRKKRADDALELAEMGVFSTPHIIAITGLPKTFTENLLKGKNSQRNGGSLNVEHLDLINTIAISWKVFQIIDKETLATVVAGGTSPRMVHKLTGLHFNTIYKWLNRQV